MTISSSVHPPTNIIILILDFSYLLYYIFSEMMDLSLPQVPQYLICILLGRMPGLCSVLISTIASQYFLNCLSSATFRETLGS